MDNVFEMDLGQLFAAADEIGSKYQSEADKAKYDAQMAAVMADIRRNAAARGEYDYEKDMWLV